MGFRGSGRQSVSTAQADQTIDDLVDAYVSWREESLVVRETYDRYLGLHGLNRPGMHGDFWPWKIKDGVHAIRAHSRQADDQAVFGGGEAGGGADGAVVAG